MSNQVGVSNSVITHLDITIPNEYDGVYTYYVMSEESHSWYQNTSATSYVSITGEVEQILFNRMKANGNAGSSGTPLSNLAFAYLKHETLINTLRPLSIKIDEIEPTLYNQMNYRFINQDDINHGVNAFALDREVLDNREVTLTSSEANAWSGVYSASAAAVSAPIYPLSYTNYSAARKMTFSEFVHHAKEKERTHIIKLIFVPFVYRHAGSVAGTPTDNVYLCSLGGIYLNGLKQTPSTLGDTAEFSKVVAVPKKFSFDYDRPDAYVDVFNDLSNLNISDVVPLVPRHCFERGVSLILYLKPYNQDMLSEYVNKTTKELALINTAWDSSAFMQSALSVWSEPRDVIYIEEEDVYTPAMIAAANKAVVFEDRLVLWRGNKVFISDEGDAAYFRAKMKREFPEEILKVLDYKNILLVFTTQHLYAIHRIEVDAYTGSFTEEGAPETIKEVMWVHQPVLYNINPEHKYLDVIQVYNQMILFYSNEGQLYMIKPSAMIDSDTQFGIQYFNKSANNILAHYEDYINERLRMYNQLDADDLNSYVTKEDIHVQALLDIDKIKIFYTAPGRMTFVVVYDVVNNRYTTYDTLSFTEIKALEHVEGGELYLTQQSGIFYLTLPVINTNDVDQNVDMHYAQTFKKEPVFTVIDTGALNLNNHLVKRLRDLRIVLKNLDATKILYNAETLLDDTTVRPFYGPDFKVRMLNAPDVNINVEEVPIEDITELFGLDQTLGVDGARKGIRSYYLHEDRDFFERNVLLKTETLNSSRLIEYNSSILGIGKVIRLRLQFISKGKYKLQSFGIVYKERRI
jgi:hypothetical protein